MPRNSDETPEWGEEDYIDLTQVIERLDLMADDNLFDSEFEDDDE